MLPSSHCSPTTRTPSPHEATSAADVLAAYAEGEKEIMNLSLSPDEGQRRSVAGFYDMEA